MKYKWWLFLAIGLFCGGMVLGFLTPTSTTNLLSNDVENLQNMLDIMSGLPKWAIFIFIFVKNVSAILISFALSPILCVVPAMALLINGGLLGWVAVSIIHEKSMGFLLAGLLPHGILEIPAFIMGEAAAFSFGAAVITALLQKDKRDQPITNLRQNLKYIVVAVMLLLPAAIIETYITPGLLK